MATIPSLIHYALDLEDPPLLACESPARNAVHTAIASKVTCPRCMSSEHYPRSIAIQPDAAPALRAYDVLVSAAYLLSDDSENPEYDRAIVELASALIGAGQDDRILMTRILRALKQGEM